MKKFIVFKVGNIHQKEVIFHNFWDTTQITLYTVG